MRVDEAKVMTRPKHSRGRAAVGELIRQILRSWRSEGWKRPLENFSSATGRFRRKYQHVVSKTFSVDFVLMRTPKVTSLVLLGHIHSLAAGVGYIPYASNVQWLAEDISDQ